MDLFDKINYSINILKRFNDPFNPYHVAFSGGKDSIILAWLCKEAKVNYRLYFYDNVLIPIEDRNFIVNYYPNCHIIKPKYNFYQLVHLKKTLPTRMRRFCCEYWKECYGKDSLVLTGIRKDESFNRSKRMLFELSPNYRFHFIKTIINPIANFSNSDASSILSGFNLILPNSYKHRNRNGCIGCPISCNRRIELFNIYPKYRIIWEKAAKIIYEYYNFYGFKSGSDVFDWYLSDVSIKTYFELKKQNKLDLLFDL